MRAAWRNCRVLYAIHRVSGTAGEVRRLRTTSPKTTGNQGTCNLTSDYSPPGYQGAARRLYRDAESAGGPTGRNCAGWTVPDLP